MKQILIFLLLFNTILFAKPDEVIKKAELYFENENYTKALEYYKLALEKNPYNTKVLWKIAEIYKILGNKNEEVKYLERIVKINPQHISALQLLGESYFLQGKLSRAAQIFNKILEIDPVNFKALSYLGRVMAYKKMYYKAVEYFKEASSIKKDDPLPFIFWAEMEILRKRYYDAEKLLKKALILAPQSPQVFFFMGVLYKSKKNFHKAIDYFEKSLNKDPDNFSTLLNLEELYIKTSSWKKAASIIEKKLIEKYNVNPLLLSHLAFSYFMLGNKEKALEAIKKYLTLNSSDDINHYFFEFLLINYTSFYNPDRIKQARVHFKKGKRYFSENLLHDALLEYRWGMRLFSEDWKAREEFARIFKKLGFLYEYLKQLDIAYKLNPDKKYLKDKYILASRKRKKTLTYKYDYEDRKIPSDKIKLLIVNFYPEKSLNPQTGGMIAQRINEVLKTYYRFVNYKLNKSEYFDVKTRDGVYQLAEKLGAEYYIWGKYSETGNGLKLDFSIYSIEKEEPLTNFSIGYIGKDKLFYLSKKAGKLINEFFPVMGRVLKIDGEKILINIGKKQGVKLNDKVEIYNRGEIMKSFIPGKYRLKKPEIKAKGEVKEIDENLALILLKKPEKLSIININDRIKIKKK